MKKQITTLFLVLFFSLTHAQSTSIDVKVKNGILRGESIDGIAIFKGVPYAAAPVNELRWRAPQPFPNWEGVRPAIKYGSDCAQMGFPRGADSISKSSSEDCLYLNIWTNALNRKASKLPVMVWIHGGAFVFGSGAQPDFSSEQFAEKDIVFVTFNYRLGRLGFFAFPALSNEYPNEPKGNYTYMDQIAALKWVRDNISSFGGDPNNVTIFGESAGGVSVQSLITIPSAKGLFHKAIIESGGGRDGVLSGRPIQKDNTDSYYPVSAEKIGINFAKRYGIEGTDALALKKLRALTVAQIVDGGQEFAGQGGPPTYAGPILDGKLVIETAQSVYNAGRQNDIPIIIGSNSAEVPAGFVNAKDSKDLFSLFGKMSKEAEIIYSENGQNDFGKMLCMVNTDKVWAEPAHFTAKAVTKNGMNAYVYLFSYVSPTMQQRMRYGASHASEIAYVFNNLRSQNGVPVPEKDKEVANLMHHYWVNFVKTANPNDKSLPVWPKFNAQKNELLEFTIQGKAEGKANPKKARIDFIEKAVTSGELH